MKILVLMPLDEQHVFAATAIYHYLPKYLQDRCFSLPMYRQYLRDCKLERSWEECLRQQHDHRVCSRIKEQIGRAHV